MLAVLVVLSVAVPVSGAARAAGVPAPVPVVGDGMPEASADGLRERYAASRDGIRAAEAVAAGHGDRRRAAALRAMAGPERQFLSFDGRDGGRAVEVFGDLAAAERIAVLVPGSDTDLDSYDRFRAGAVALREETGGRVAVIAWLGYATPSALSLRALTAGRADEGASRLRGFVERLGATLPAGRISLLCHSYGSVVCARAVSGLRVSDVVLYGSPGTGADSVDALRTGATVWAGRGGGDWIADVPHVRLPLVLTTVGFGTDPVSDEFGARVFDAGEGGHSDYLKPGSVALRNIGRIVSGRDVPGHGVSGVVRGA
nr:alpha/beta hydrolase [Streptomyces sp. TRM64462]